MRRLFGAIERTVVREGLYVHIPFCRQRCNYCGLPSTTCRDGDVQPYLAALARECAARCSTRIFDSLFVGGGTPSLLDEEQLTYLFSRALAPARLAEGSEASFECNPESLTSSKARLLRSMGLNRISIGAQSLDGGECRLLGRLHGPADVRQAFASCKRVGFENVSLDLLLGFPGHSASTWQKTLAEACRLEPTHVSVYVYHREDNTPFDRELAAGTLTEVDEDLQVEMYYYARDVLAEAGYEHYEISNFARPGYRCQHNLNYWYGGSYCGLGAAAASHEHDLRFTNVVAPERYVEALQARTSAVDEEDSIPAEAKWREALMLRLRLLEPTVLRTIEPLPSAVTLAEAEETLTCCADEGLVEVVDGGFMLSTQGLIVANEVMARVIQ